MLLEFESEILNGMNDGDKISGLLDITKAFDTVDHIVGWFVGHVLF